MQDRLPAVLKMLSDKCLGVAVLEVKAGERSTISLDHFTGPVLVYVFEHKKPFGPYGRSFTVFLGGRPVEKPPEKHSLFSKFPDALKEFYLSIHDGWCANGAWDGPWPLAQVQLLVDRMPDTDEFESNKKKPFSMRDMIDIVETGNGDAFCLDVKRSTKQKAVGCYFYHDAREESLLNQDFWGMINQRIEEVVMPDFLMT